MYALVDCNNFYASCERLFRPELNGKPVVVLSNNDGCVIARSNESKALGIKMGEPYFLREQFLKENGVHVFSSNYTLYGDISNRVMTTLAEFAPETEIYSIDECFLNLRSLQLSDINQFAINIRESVLQNIGIPTGIGVASSKTLAKSANHYAKKNCRNGVFVIDSEEKREMVLTWHPVSDVWGIGRQYSAWLESHGILNAWQLANANQSWIRQKMGVVGVRLVKELNGIPCIPLEEVPTPKKEICTSRSFGRSLTEKDQIRESVVTHITRCAEKLRKQRSAAGAIQIFLHTNRFKDLPQYYGQITIPLLSPSSLTNELVHYGMVAFERIYREGYSYKKSGAILLDIVQGNQVQQALFSNKYDREKGEAVMKALDSINNLIGQDAVRYASAGYSKGWRLKNDHISPRYTTHASEILRVKN